MTSETLFLEYAQILKAKKSALNGFLIPWKYCLFCSFENIFEQSASTNPIVFILSPGSDPASDLLKLAERSGFGTNKVKFLSMGQGQEKVSIMVYVL